MSVFLPCQLNLAPDAKGISVNLSTPSGAGRTKVEAADIVENQNAHLLVVVPVLAAGTYRLEVTTQFGGGGTLLKEPRTTALDKPLTVS